MLMFNICSLIKVLLKHFLFFLHLSVNKKKILFELDVNYLGLIRTQYARVLQCFTHGTSNK